MVGPDGSCTAPPLGPAVPPVVRGSPPVVAPGGAVVAVAVVVVVPVSSSVAVPEVARARGVPVEVVPGVPLGSFLSFASEVATPS